MDSVLADIDVADPTAHADSDVEMADIAPRAVQKQRKQKRDEKGHKSTMDGKSEDNYKRRKHGEVNGESDGKKKKKSKKA